VSAPRSLSHTVTRIVSVTPSRVDFDARTYKEAATFARHGYHSLVVEAMSSTIPTARLPFEVHGRGVPPHGQGDTPVPPVGQKDTRPGPLRRAWRSVPSTMREGVERLLRVPLTIAHHLGGARAAARALPQAQVYWLHGYHQFPAVWLASRRRGVPFVYDAHDFYPEIIEGGAGTAVEQRAMRWFYTTLERVCARTAAEVITVSDGLAELIEDRVGRPPRVVRNCAELRTSAGVERDVRDLLGIAPDAFLLVVVGNHKPGMCAAEAVEALVELPEHVHLAFVGQGYKTLAQQAARVGVAERAHFCGRVTALEVPSFIRTADLAAVLYVGSSRNLENSLPNGFFAAVGAGLPLLYPRLREIRRLAEQHALGLAIDPADPASVAQAVRDLLADTDRLSRLRHNAEQARQTLSWEHEERTVLAVAERLIGSRG
jgi:glycosyltransferase involved in cell wall biosynthesis